MSLAAKDAPPGLVTLLEQARELGFLGPAAVEDQIVHAHAFADAVGESIPARVLDLGSGGGVPGLVLALRWPEASVVLLEAAARKGEFLSEGAVALGLADRVDVVVMRAEAAGRDPVFRGAFSLVTARGFGAPAVTAECGAPFLELGGELLVSDPPSAPEDRWPVDGLEAFGLVNEGVFVAPRAHIRRLRAVELCPENWPRGIGQPAKRPSFGR